jgi:hypothetical protein
MRKFISAAVGIVDIAFLYFVYDRIWNQVFKTENAHKAYLAISFEREAYAKEDDFDYLKKRKFWNFIKYW